MPDNRQKILIIEDDKSLVNLVEQALVSKGFEIILAVDAEEGIDKAILDQPAIIILDILLPGKTGFECLEKLKENSKTKNIPVIILSNLGQDQEIREGLKLGAADYLVKADLTIDEVATKIIKHLK